jgi:hypothetical protein
MALHRAVEIAVDPRAHRLGPRGVGANPAYRGFAGDFPLESVTRLVFLPEYVLRAA